MSGQMSFREQLQAMLDENVDKYPDAVEWMVQASERTDPNRKTRYEKFVERLSTTNKFSNNPYDPDEDNIIEFIKWHRAKTGLGLKESKYACDAYIKENYPECKRAMLNPNRSAI